MTAEIDLIRHQIALGIVHLTQPSELHCRAFKPMLLELEEEFSEADETVTDEQLELMAAVRFRYESVLLVTMNTIRHHESSRERINTDEKEWEELSAEIKDHLKHHYLYTYRLAGDLRNWAMSLDQALTDLLIHLTLRVLKYGSPHPSAERLGTVFRVSDSLAKAAEAIEHYTELFLEKVSTNNHEQQTNEPRRIPK